MSTAPAGSRTSPFASPAAILIAIAVASFAAVAAALVSQHVFDMQPCPWCVLQRLVFVTIGVVAVVGAIGRHAVARRLASTVVVLLALGGIAAALWQHFVAAHSESCNLTLADRIVAAVRLNELLPDVFEARASCADAAVNLLGVPYDVWSMALFAIVGAAAIVTLRRRP